MYQCQYQAFEQVLVLSQMLTKPILCGAICINTKSMGANRMRVEQPCVCGMYTKGLKSHLVRLYNVGAHSKYLVANWGCWRSCRGGPPPSWHHFHSIPMGS